MSVLEQVVNFVGRSLERLLTGQSDYRVAAGPFPESDRMEDPFLARQVLGEVRQELAREFGIRLADPVVLDLERPSPGGWKRVANPEAHLGRYRSRQMGRERIHQVQVAPGLPRLRFRGVLAHELAHAWQVERRVLASSPAMREGMARWVEYHVLQAAGGRSEARRLLRIRSYLFGHSLRRILQYEERHGRARTMDWLRSIE